MQTLITGGAGFLGTHLVNSLLGKGHRVVVIDNFITGSRENVALWNSHPRFSFYEMGIETDAFLRQFLNSPAHALDRIYHLACPTGVPNIELLGEEMMDASSFGTKNVLRVAHKHNARVLFTSSSEVYGAPEVFPQTEEYTGNVDPQGWRASYEEGKRFSEALVSLFVQAYGVNARTVRLFNSYGQHMSVRDQRVIPQFIQQGLRGETITVFNNNALRTFCYAEDTVRGLELAMEKGRSGGIYNIGSDQEIDMFSLAEKVISALESESEIELIPAAYPDHQRRMPDLAKIRALGWKQSISLEDGLALTIEYFKKVLVAASSLGSKQRV